VGVDKASLGPVLGAGLFGMLVGSLALSVLADRIGRRPVLIGASSSRSSCWPLRASRMRFIAGLAARLRR
jgi:AAHS family 4-hydroxybenzoate transporter-like MFS transporter